MSECTEQPFIFFIHTQPSACTYAFFAAHFFEPKNINTSTHSSRTSLKAAIVVFNPRVSWAFFLWPSVVLFNGLLRTDDRESVPILIVARLLCGQGQWNFWFQQTQNQDEHDGNDEEVENRKLP